MGNKDKSKTYGYNKLKKGTLTANLKLAREARKKKIHSNPANSTALKCTDAMLLNQIEDASVGTRTIDSYKDSPVNQHFGKTLTTTTPTAICNNYTDTDYTMAGAASASIMYIADSSKDNLAPIYSNDTDDTLEIESEIAPELELHIQGRRIVDFQFFMNQIKSLNNHNKAFGCTIDNIKFIKEINNGLHSDFIVKCSMCNIEFTLHTTDKSDDNMDVNHGAVTGAMMIGVGMSNLNECLASIDLPTLKQKTYSRCHDEIADYWQRTAEKCMLEAAEEEKKAAFACGDVKNGIATITVVADCCWSKRSYRTNYSATSGVAAIIGYRTGKVLYMDVKNKYCVICARAATKKVTPAIHKCQINHQGSSTSMEQNIIVEGFKTSVRNRNLIYGTLIADGDASTYKKIVECRPYPNLQVEKIECSNHLLRNYGGKILSLVKDTSIPLAERKTLTADRMKRLRLSIKSAVRFRKAQKFPVTDQIINLKKDILNSPYHIFGDHRKCDAYYCSEERKKEDNLVVNLPSLFRKLINFTTQIALHAKSLLYDVNNNRAEQFNSVVAKLVGGKRINFSLKNSYTARCHAAVVSFNTSRPQYILYKSKYNKSPGKVLKDMEMARLNLKLKRKTLPCKRRLRVTDIDKSNYGNECQRPDMTKEEYDVAKKMFIENLQEQVMNRQELERDTVLQAESALWLELRRCLLTASMFSKVCKRRDGTSSAPLVKSLLYGYSLENVASVKHGKQYEKVAIEQLEKEQKIQIKKCGLFVDQELFFLGASPDGLYEEGIVEIKCPSSAFGITADEAISQKKIRFWNQDGTVNKRHDWFYQVQGQLHITQQNICIFAVWTGEAFKMKIAKIYKDDEFWNQNMAAKLINFYNKCLLPEIVDPRKARSMPLRDTVY